MDDFLKKARKHFGGEVRIVEMSGEVIFIKEGKKWGQYLFKDGDWPPPAKMHDEIFKSIEQGFNDDKQRTHNLWQCR